MRKFFVAQKFWCLFFPSSFCLFSLPLRFDFYFGDDSNNNLFSSTLIKPWLFYLSRERERSSKKLPATCIVECKKSNFIALSNVKSFNKISFASHVLVGIIVLFLRFSMKVRTCFHGPMFYANRITETNNDYSDAATNTHTKKKAHHTFCLIICPV